MCHDHICLLPIWTHALFQGVQTGRSGVVAATNDVSLMCSIHVPTLNSLSREDEVTTYKINQTTNGPTNGSHLSFSVPCLFCVFSGPSRAEGPSLKSGGLSLKRWRAVPQERRAWAVPQEWRGLLRSGWPDGVRAAESLNCVCRGGRPGPWYRVTE